MLSGVVGWLIEALFPTHCLQCRAEGEWWCHPCRTQEKLLTERSFCASCHAPSASTCDTCRSLTRLDSMYALYPYTSESVLGQLIQQFKYHHQKTIQEVWKKVVMLEREKYVMPIIIPVPLFRARERDRDYNQSAVIAGCLAEKYSLPLDTRSLVRVRVTKQQATLSREERYENVQGAFVWQGGEVPKEVLLVDDVFTTGATLEACAQALKDAGIEVIHGFTLAIGGKQ